jgi:hypothetical protein
MLSEQEQGEIRIVSDTALYPEALELMKGLGKTLPPTQINGLLNVSLANTYENLQRFVQHQSARSTWASRDQHIPDFYKRFQQKLKQIEKTYVPVVTRSRQEKPSHLDEDAIKMALAREFIQHILAENAYKAALYSFQSDQAGHNAKPSPHNLRDQRK